MKKLMLALTLLAFGCSAVAQEQTTQDKGGKTVQRASKTITISGSGGGVTFANDIAGMTTSFEEIIAGAPTSSSIVVSGCKAGNNCNTLDTYTGNVTAIRGVALDTAYDYFKVVATWAGGTNVSVTLNWTLTTARNGNGGSGGAVTSVAGKTGAVTLVEADITSLSPDLANATGAPDTANDYAVGGGTAQAQTVTLVPSATLTNGIVVRWKPAAANTGAAPTLAVNGLTAKPITKLGATALVANDIVTTAIAEAFYDGTNWELQNPQTNIGTSSSGGANDIQFALAGGLFGSDPGKFTYSSSSHQMLAMLYGFYQHNEIGWGAVLSSSKYNALDVIVPVGGTTVYVTMQNDSTTNKFSWPVGATFQLTALACASPCTTLNTLDNVDFTVVSLTDPTDGSHVAACAVAQPCNVAITVLSGYPTSGTYVLNAGTASIYAITQQGHTVVFSRLESSSANPSKTGSIRLAHSDHIKYRNGSSATGSDNDFFTGTTVGDTNRANVGDTPGIYVPGPAEFAAASQFDGDINVAGNINQTSTSPTQNSGIKQASTSVTVPAGADYSMFVGSDNHMGCQLAGGGSCLPAPAGARFSSGTSGPIALNTVAIAPNTCNTTTVAITGVATTDVISWTPNGSIKTLTGYAPVTTGGLSITPYPTVNNVNFDVCNWTTSSITPSAVTLNWYIL